MGVHFFFIHGHPAPGGSKTVMFFWTKDGRLVTKTSPSGRQMPVFNVTDDAGKNNKLWKQAVSLQGRSFMLGAKPFEGPLKVEFTFYLRRPQCHYRTGKFANLLRDDAPTEHIVKPDALKFARSTEDALTSVLWADDSQTVSITSSKRYCATSEKTGCLVNLTVL